MERHPFDPWSAVFGLLFVGVGAAFMSDKVSVTDVDGRVGIAVFLVFIGLLIAGGLVRKPVKTEVASPAPEPDENP